MLFTCVRNYLTYAGMVSFFSKVLLYKLLKKTTLLRNITKEKRLLYIFAMIVVSFCFKL